jgi:tetratricopeptide (TPR) repeat protein
LSDRGAVLDRIFRVGRIYEERIGDLDQAVATFRRLHELHPGYVAAYFMCGQVLAEQGKNDEARSELQQGLVAAHADGDGHAIGEMTSLLDSLD